MSFNGYLIKFVKNGKQFPHKLIAENGFSATPQQRTEIKAYRDSNNLLHRTTSPNNKTKLEITTIELSLSQMEDIRNALDGAFSNSQQRKLQVQYWDDELLAYRTMTAYMPDPTYTAKVITSNNIKYSPMTFTFIEY